MCLAKIYTRYSLLPGKKGHCYHKTRHIFGFLFISHFDLIYHDKFTRHYSHLLQFWHIFWLITSLNFGEFRTFLLKGLARLFRALSCFSLTTIQVLSGIYTRGSFCKRYDCLSKSKFNVTSRNSDDNYQVIYNGSHKDAESYNMSLHNFKSPSI